MTHLEYFQELYDIWIEELGLFYTILIFCVPVLALWSIYSLLFTFYCFVFGIRVTGTIIEFKKTNLLLGLIPIWKQLDEAKPIVRFKLPDRKEMIKKVDTLFINLNSSMSIEDNKIKYFQSNTGTKKLPSGTKIDLIILENGKVIASGLVMLSSNLPVIAILLLMFLLLLPSYMMSVHEMEEFSIDIPFWCGTVFFVIFSVVILCAVLDWLKVRSYLRQHIK